MLTVATAARQVVERAKLDPATLVGAPVRLDGLERLPENTIVTNADDQPLVAYLRLWQSGDAVLEALRTELLELKFAESRRVNGLSVRAKSFGYLPRITIRTTDYCRPAIVMRQHPALAAVLTELAAILETRYAAVAPDTYRHHAEVAETKVHKAWRLPGSACFTGGTINRDNAIGYHQDRGNVAATFSAMPIVRQHMTGGELVIPELGVYAPAADGTVVYFDGQDLWHAVTPMAKARRDAHRFSIVYYSLTDLFHCLPPAEEVARIQAVRTEREVRRAHGNPPPRNVAASARAKAAAIREARR
jgi:hypothetical protein